MLTKPLKLLRSLCRQSRGNATLIVAFGMPALIGGAGFAVDTAQWYMWKRELQHAVDQAAIAGAWALAQDKNSTTYETRALQEYQANLQVTEDFANEQPAVRKADFAGGNGNSIVVSSTATRSLPFSSFLTGKGVTIRATAQAKFAAGANYSACLVSTADDGTGTSIGGNATVKAKCGLAALSCDDDAIEIDASATVQTDSIVACGTVTVPEENQDVVTENQDGLKDLFKDIEAPTNDKEGKYECIGKGNNKVATVLDGTFAGGITVKCTTVFKGGIYVIDGGVLDLTGNYDVTGTGVMFVLRNGATIKLGGSGNSNAMNLTPMESSAFEGGPYQDKADDLAGMLIIEDRNNTDSGLTHIINGNSNSLIEGIIYLPVNEARVNGTADIASQCLQVSAYRIKVLGGANLETLCPTEDTMSVGSSLAKVSLVA